MYLQFRVNRAQKERTGKDEVLVPTPHRIRARHQRSVSSNTKVPREQFRVGPSQKAEGKHLSFPQTSTAKRTQQKTEGEEGLELGKRGGVG